MNRFHKSLIGLVWLSFLVEFIIHSILYERLSGGNAALLIAVPTLLAFLFRFLFRKNKNPYRLQWLPVTLNILLLLRMVFVSFTLIAYSHGAPYERTMQEQHIALSVKKWIKENAAYPDTYQSVDFGDFFQIVKRKNDSIENGTDYDFMPIGLYYKTGKFPNPEKLADIDYAIYMIEHTFILEGNNHRLYTVDAYFQLTPELEITNVRILPEMESKYRKEMTYQWRVIFGNKNKTLELEKYGHDDSIYKYQFFKAINHSRFRFGWITAYRSKIISYAKGQRNGPVYSIANADTVQKAMFNNDQLDGISYDYSGGSMTKMVHYKANELSGLSTEFYPNGSKKEEGYYIRDEKVGEWKYWDEQGNLSATNNFGRQTSLDSLLK